MKAKFIRRHNGSNFIQLLRSIENDIFEASFSEKYEISIKTHYWSEDKNTTIREYFEELGYHVNFSGTFEEGEIIVHWKYLV